MMTLQKNTGDLVSLDAEVFCLGALLMPGPHVHDILDRVASSDFSEPLHGRIFAIAADLIAQGKSASPVTVAPFLATDDAIKQLGGVGYLATLTGNAAVLIGVRDVATTVADMAKRRRLIAAGQEAADHAGDMTLSLDEAFALADGAINAAKGDHGGVDLIKPGQTARDILAEQGKPIWGVKSRNIPADVFPMPRPSELIIVAARPGMGKSAFASSYSLGAAQNGHGVLFVSLEMGDKQITTRMLSDLTFDGRTGVPAHLVRDNAVKSDDDFERLDHAIKQLDAMPLMIVDISDLTAGRLASIARRAKRQFEARGHDLDLIVVDYLQLMRGKGKGDNNRVQEVSEISRGLKLLAKDMGVAVVALSQLSRAVEQREDKRPRLSDLRESGSIEQDADNVLFLYRPEYYLAMAEPEQGTVDRMTWEDEMRRSAGVLEVIAAKLRNGRTGVNDAYFSGLYQAVRGLA